MDFTLSLSSDWFNLMNIPLILLTLKDVIPKWSSIWDDNFSSEDRRLMLRIVIFLALPVVVLIHELGHLFAAFSVGAHVLDFHYGPVAGHVTVEANLPDDKMLWIAFAGNLAQIVLGLLSLSLALLCRSAAMVAFLVYLGLYSIGDTVIFYALLSFASNFGDWKQMYENPCVGLVHGIEIFQAIMVVLILWCIYASAPKAWFTRKTRPEWSDSHKRYEQAVAHDPSVENLVALATSFMEAGLYTEAQNCLNKAEKIASESPLIRYTKADLELSKGNTDKGLAIYEELSEDQQIATSMRAQILLQMGEIYLYRRASDLALKYFKKASQLDPSLGDARLQNALLCVNLKKYDHLADDLEHLRKPDTYWVYARNQKLAEQEIPKLEIILSRLAP